MRNPENECIMMSDHLFRKMEKPMFTCEFCGNDFDYEGIDDLAPLSDEGYCCESCYSLYVIPAKMREMNPQAYIDIDSEDDSEDFLSDFPTHIF